MDHPLRWQTANFLDKFSAVTLEALTQERKTIEDALAMLDVPPQTKDDEGARKFSSKQLNMWIAELLDNSYSDSVTSDIGAFDEETKGDGVLLFYVFLRENILVFSALKECPEDEFKLIIM
jgi:hypothetical protein